MSTRWRLDKAALTLVDVGDRGPTLLRRPRLAVDDFVLDTITERVERGESGGDRDESRDCDGDGESTRAKRDSEQSSCDEGKCARS